MPEDESQKRYNHIIEVIDKRLIPDEVAKKARGEVFTPLNLVREMLFGIRKTALDKGHTEIWGFKNDTFIDEDEKEKIGGIPLDVWRNPKSTFLDPANGIGNFPVVVFYMLDYQLGKHGPAEFKGDNNKKKRRTHIVKNMLYMIELNKGNVNTSRKIFEKLAPGVIPNICCSDSTKLLEDKHKLEKEFGISQFDVIMGNPPYQPNLLWEKFIVKSILRLKPNGYISFVVPTSWTSPTSDSWKEFKKLDIQVINSAEYLKKEYFPNVSSTFSYFIVKNAKPGDNTIIINDFNTYITLNLKNILFLPKIITKETISINNKVLTNKLAGRFIRKDMGANHITSNSVYRHPFITFIKTDGEPDIKYHNIGDPRQSKKKVLLFRNGYINPYYDDGKYGVGDNIHALEVDTKKQGEDIVSLFKSKLYSYIFNINKHSAFNHGGLMDIVNRDVSDFDSFSDNDIYKYFNLTPEEITTIEDYAPKKRETKASKTKKAKGGSQKTIGKTRKLKRN